jgi:hypothetical protein
MTDQAPSADVLLLSIGQVIVSLMLFWMGLCITVKRYHDWGKSAWWYLIQFIPIIGGIWALVELGFCSGDDGDNEYGAGPDLNISEDLKALREVRSAGRCHVRFSLPALSGPANQRAAVFSASAPDQ